MCGCDDRGNNRAELPDLPDPAITSFSFAPEYNPDAAAGPDEAGITEVVDGEIDQAAETIYAIFPTGGVDLGALVASFENTYGAVVRIGDVVQESNISNNDFSSAVSYEVKTEDGRTRVYTVTAINGQNSATELYYYTFVVDVMDDNGNPVQERVECVVNSATGEVTASVKYEADLMQIVPSFKTSPRSTLSIGQTAQISGETEVNLASPVTYTIESEEGNTQDYTVTITKDAPWTGNDLNRVVFRASDNPDLSGDLEAEINEQDKTITIPKPDGFDMERVVPHVEISPKAIVKLDDGEIVADGQYDFLNAGKLTVYAQDGTPNEYRIILKSIAVGSFEIDAANVSGMTMTTDNVQGEIVYSMSEMSDNATAVTNPIDYINPGKVLSFKYKSSKAVQMKIQLNDNAKAISELWELQPAAEWTDYAFDMELMARIFKWNKSAGSDYFTLTFVDAAGASIEISELEIRSRTPEEQVPFDNTYWLSYTGESVGLSIFEDLTTCYAPGHLTYRLGYPAVSGYTQEERGILQQVDRTLDIDMKYIEFEFFVEGGAADYQTLFTRFKYTTTDWFMCWNWDCGASLYYQFNTWTPKVLNMNKASDVWPNNGEPAPKPALNNMHSHSGDAMFVNPQLSISFGLVDGNSSFTDNVVTIRGLRVTKTPGPGYGDFDPID